jgi:RNA polymerase sigma factor (sigma-70 family)
MINQTQTDGELLREFIQHSSEPAFAELVRRHEGWIYASARRQAGEDSADDLTQAVFLVLLQKADIAARQPVLSAWLFGVLRLVVLRWRRDEMRKTRHRRGFAELHGTNPVPQMDMEVLAILDEAVGRLREKDRHAIVVRFYEQRNFMDVGRALGISEEAARKRLDRAVAKLRRMLLHRGISGTLEVFSAGVLAKMVSQPPPGSILAAANLANVKPAPMALHLSKGAMRMMAIQQGKAVILSVLLTILATGGGLAGYVLCQSPHLSAATEPIAQPKVQMVKFISTISEKYNNIVVAISRNNLHISAYSDRTGKWAPLPIDADVLPLLARYGDNYPPIITAEGIAALRLGKHLYAYSAETGTWDKLDVDDRPAADPDTRAGMAMVNYDDRFAVFSEHTGKWATVLWDK